MLLGGAAEPPDAGIGVVVGTDPNRSSMEGDAGPRPAVGIGGTVVDEGAV
jgi:hypothetical protein